MIIVNGPQLNFIPQRIISLVPSQTELLYSLQLDQQTVGITKFCIHPKEWHTVKTRIGGTKNINIDTIKKLQPDLIIANKEENVKEQIEMLATDYPVWVTDVNTVADALHMILDIGQLTGKSEAAASLVSNIKHQFSTIVGVYPPIRTAYLIWNNPYMTIGGDTFINDILKKAGLQNVFEKNIRYPQITVNDIKNSNCQLLLLSSEPYPFKQQHIASLQQYLPGVKMMLADGEMFSWYGSRMLLVPEYLKHQRGEWSMVNGE
jgi:ABC-type Fe3+-hydroxamate transport system substrate-binding protein